MMWVLDKDGDGVNLDLVTCLIAWRNDDYWELRAHSLGSDDNFVRVATGAEKYVKAVRDKILAKLLDPDLADLHEPA